jgi:hypothetical protein
MGNFVMVAESDKFSLQNRCRRHEFQKQQVRTLMWTIHTGDTKLPPMHERPHWHCNKMCPAGIAKSHPVGTMLAGWLQLGCLTETGQTWLKQVMWEAVA